MTQTRQPEGIPTGGQYAATAHSDAVPGLGTLPSVEQLIERRNARLDEIAELESLLAVDAARALAAHTRQMFPTAATIHFEESNRWVYEAMPWKITDAEGHTLAGERDWDTRAEFAAWCGANEDETSANYLAIDLRGRRDRLKDAITPVTRVGYPEDTELDGLHFELDLDKVLEGDAK